MASKRKRERRRAIAGQRVAATKRDARLGLPDRPVVSPRRDLPGVRAPSVTASSVRDVSVPGRLAPLPIPKAPRAVSTVSTVKPAYQTPAGKAARVASAPVRVSSPSFKRPRALNQDVSSAPSISRRNPSPVVLPSPTLQPSPASIPSRKSFTPPPTCKPRPSSSTSKGGGSRPYIPWCR